MKTDQLIQGLIADLPTQSGSVAKAITVSVSLSVIVSLTAMLLWFGLRPDIGEAMHSAPFWAKAGYALVIGTAGLFALERLGRPGASATLSFVIVSVAVTTLAIAGVTEIVMAPPGDVSQLWLGASSSICPWAIVGLSIPLLIAAFIALRQLAPTQFAIAGTAAGLMAGGYAACIYSLHCTEYGLSFLAIWYTLGMLIVAAGGALLSGLLRW